MPAVASPPDTQILSFNNDASKNLDFDLPALDTHSSSREATSESPSSKHFLQNPAPALCLRALTLLVWHDWSCLGARALAPHERDADSGLGKEPLSLWGCEMCFPVWPWWMGLVAGTKRRIKKADLFEMSNPCKKTTSFPPVRSKARQNPSYPLVSENER